MKLVFAVDEGPKVKVGMISFQGNHAFSDRRILRSMKNTHPYSIPLWLFDVPFMSKTFDRNKLDQDLEIGVRALYQDNGYFKVVVKDPILKTADVTEGHLPGPVPLGRASPGQGYLDRYSHLRRARNITWGVW